MNARLYTTGEFAKLTGVKKQTLLWYDKIGLFTPQVIKDNGYRYYSLSQFDLFMVIRSLSTIGLSLDEIKTVIEHRTSDEIDVFVKKQINKIDQQMLELAELKKSLDQWSNRIEMIPNLDVDKIQVVIRDTEELLISQNFRDLTVKERSLEIVKLANYRYESKEFGDCIGGIVSRQNFDNRQTEYDYYFTVTDRHVGNFSKPAGPYLVAYHRGNYTETYFAYERMQRFADENGLVLGDKVFEKSQVDETLASNENEWITEIEMQVVGTK